MAARETCKRSWTAIGATVAPVVLAVVVASRALQTPAVRSAEEKVLREYVGVYHGEPNAY
jgi:hypothetical protein